MKIGNSRMFALAAAHGASLLAVPDALQAQSTGALEEIIVTARQREERIEDVPVTITAFTAAEIQNAGIERPQDFIALTPGVSQVQTAEAGDLQVNIRGINTSRDAETNFALVVDGVLQTNPNALNQELVGRHADRNPQGPARRAVWPQRRGWRVDHDDAQAWRRMGERRHRRLRQRQYLQGQHLRGRAHRRRRQGLALGVHPHTDGQWKNLKIDCDDCVDKFEETGVSGRLLFDLGGGESTSRPSIPRSIGCDQSSTPRSRWSTRRRSWRAGVLRRPERARVPLHQQHQAAERAGEHQPVAQGRLGRRLRDA